jgi:hypothetical protein
MEQAPPGGIPHSSSGHKKDEDAGVEGPHRMLDALAILDYSLGKEIHHVQAR